MVQILDYGDDRGTPYLAMELLEGEDLRTRIERVRRLSLVTVSGILNQLSKGLKLAHDAGIIHRDLKPSNVFMARVGDEEIVKILDFGVAKEIRPASPGESTATGLLLGSPAYMSPEQARGGTIDHRSDLWSVGVICYLALTGQRPFSGGHVGDVLVKVCSTEPPRAASLAPGLPPEIDAFFDRALCKSPDGRFASARAMAEALAAIATGSSLPVSTRSAAFAASPSVGTVSDGPASARTEATVSLRGVPSDRPARSDATVGAVVDGASASAVQSTSRSARSRWTWAVLGSVTVLSLGVVLAVWLREGGASPRRMEIWPLGSSESNAPAPAATVVATPREEAPAPAPTPSAPAPEVAPSPSSSATTTAVPTPVPQAATPRGRRPPQPARAPSAQPTVDPKFGLPVQPSP